MTGKKLLFAVAAALSACTAVHYESPRLGDRPGGRDTIAVLPFEMVFTGKAPAGATAAQIAALEEAESLAFQHALYSRLLERSSVTRERPIQARIQPLETTNRVLDERGIGLRESWVMPAEELAAVLEVDAVVRTRVVKQRYLSDLASYATDVGLEVVHGASEGRADWLIPPGLARTHDVYADSILVSGADGDLLWKVEVHRATDWRRPANDVIVGITRKLARKFPYRG
ncbi:MAG: hypothetical protein OES32_03510 [Acidobacteriota bacterium]|nr:hypothetical protein [Acidobacteriota bacterium]MDH3522631.1 hypothetical protein [Acidobacteriota bacterium]